MGDGEGGRVKFVEWLSATEVDNRCQSCALEKLQPEVATAVNLYAEARREQKTRRTAADLHRYLERNFEYPLTVHSLRRHLQLCKGVGRD
jgi:hypothetical protein